jgi:hypothetical protein
LQYYEGYFSSEGLEDQFRAFEFHSMLAEPYFTKYAEVMESIG